MLILLVLSHVSLFVLVGVLFSIIVDFAQSVADALAPGFDLVIYDVDLL